MPKIVSTKKAAKHQKAVTFFQFYIFVVQNSDALIEQFKNNFYSVPNWNEGHIEHILISNGFKLFEEIIHANVKLTWNQFKK